MNPNYIHTITLYNCIKAKDSGDKQDHWQRTVLKNCFYKAKEEIVPNGTGISKANTYTVRIPEDTRYRRYSEYCKDPEEHFTVSNGDIVVLGECTDEIGKEMAASKLLLKYKPDAFSISTFSDNTGYFAGRHYKIGG